MLNPISAAQKVKVKISFSNGRYDLATTQPVTIP